MEAPNIVKYKLNAQQEQFCQEYIIDRNQTQAYIRAGYSKDGARHAASLLLTNVNVRARVNQLIKEQVDKIKISATFIIREILNAATIDIADAYDDNGKLLPINEMPEPLRKSITSIETDELFEGTGNQREHIGTTKKIKIQDRAKSLELLGKHLKMFTDVVEIPGLEGLADKIRKARERVKKNAK